MRSGRNGFLGPAFDRCIASITAAALASIIVPAFFAPAAASPFLPLPSQPTAQAPLVPVVAFGQNARLAPEAFATSHGLDVKDTVRNHVASGLIQCGNAHGAGQLTLTDDVITSAAHVFFDENGLPRASTCTFDITVDGHETRVPIDLGSIVAGSTKPYDAAVAHDWAVARLTHAISGVRPYGIAGDIHDNEATTFVARGHIDWGGARQLSMQTCLLHDQLSQGQEGTREFSFDCDTGDGASGGALMFGDSDTRIGAILVGWRSRDPFKAQPFSHAHYNFAVTMEGAFRQAVFAAANKVYVQR